MDRVIVQKGWGNEVWIVNKPEYCGKILYFEKGKRCSYHYHPIKDETMYVVSGAVEILYGNVDFSSAKSIILQVGYDFHIPPGLCHMIIGLEDSRVVEFSTQHFEEDSIRVVPGDSQK
jgi:quercetin dioxygenase-like cupin family protein